MDFLMVTETARAAFDRVIEGTNNLLELFCSLSSEEIFHAEDEDITAVITPTGFSSFIIYHTPEQLPPVLQTYSEAWSETNTTTSPDFRSPYFLNDTVLHQNLDSTQPITSTQPILFLKFDPPTSSLPPTVEFPLTPESTMSICVSPTRATTMTVFPCRHCKVLWQVRSSDLPHGPIDGYSVAHWRVQDGVPSRCLNCVIVLGAIHKLRNEVVRFPWLVTEGMAGAPKKQAWEMVGGDEGEEDDDDDNDNNNNGKVDSGRGSAGGGGGDREWGSDGRTKEEGEKFRQQMAEGFMKTAGKAVSEEEALELGGGKN
ncbi:uncharacterized protein HMPREF1541_01076 [Cyphellophora europaea CBS 101466]|uniref:Uncharacterized protein n=1 Tax=Cyphellophora europaea (strain CBS 101466) TaxID=1220924 RepID=W2SDY9_CYPE1|nr:uncharacterized protein HMPREF1541_01076 [Cyphellophora europaea CBS 101466]ETN46887.1 hypothetical protein HMPREF1541_01076 [Cyphellophora europaea CBS 101466]